MAAAHGLRFAVQRMKRRMKTSGVTVVHLVTLAIGPEEHALNATVFV
jgi:hypothetical protein